MELIDNIFVSSIVSLLIITLLNIVNLNQQIIVFLTLFLILLFKTFLENNKKEKEEIMYNIKQQEIDNIKQQEIDNIKQQEIDNIKKQQMDNKESKNLILSSNNKNFLNFIKIKPIKVKKIKKKKQCYFPLKMKDNLTLSKLNEHNDYISRDCIEDGSCLI